MKEMCKKVQKVLTLAICVALIFGTVNVSSLIAMADAGSMVEESVSGNDMEKTQTELHEESLVAIAQKALTDIQGREVVAIQAANSALETLTATETLLAQVEMSESISYELYRKILVDLPKLIKHADASVINAQKAVKKANGLLSNAMNGYERTLKNINKTDKAVTGAKAKEILQLAQESVNVANAKWQEAQGYAERVNQVAQQVRDSYARKPVIVNFYVLNRGLPQPEFSAGPEKNYSKAVQGELYSGVENHGVSDISYLPIYFEEGTEQNIATYVKLAPTFEELKTVVPDLAEDEEIKWYVIKPVGADRVVHVDGIIQKKAIEEPTEDNEGSVSEGDSTPEDEEVGDNEGSVSEGDSTPEDEEVGDNEGSVSEGDSTPEDEEVGDDEGSVSGGDSTPEDEEVGDDEGSVSEGDSTPDDEDADDNDVNVSEGENMDSTPEDREVTIQRITPTNIEGTPTATIVTTPVTSEDNMQATTTEAVVMIAEEETALASGIATEEEGAREATNEETIVIEEEKVPLAAGVHCGVHWLILILTLIYTIFALIRSISRNNKINQLKEALEEKNATV